jgi:hypothetical protein
MKLLQQAIANASIAANSNASLPPIHSQVKITDNEYFGTIAKVTGYSFNMLDMQIVDVKTEQGTELGFYPHELEIV